jgi:hypothetical protein
MKGKKEWKSDEFSVSSSVTTKKCRRNTQLTQCSDNRDKKAIVRYCVASAQRLLSDYLGPINVKECARRH